MKNHHGGFMRVVLALVLGVLVSVPGAIAQDDAKSEELLRKIDQALRLERERLRTDVLETVRQELKGAGAPPPPRIPDRPPVAPAAGGNLEKAKALVTTDLLKKHAYFLADDALEGRCSGYPGCNKAADYLAEAMKKADLAPAGNGGTYFQKFKVKGRDTQNVIGLIEGSDPDLKKEYVVIGAHYDHVGTADQDDFGRLGGGGDDKIWNGADDNASGTTAVLGAIKAFGEGALKPRRSVLFILFSGEEAGLIGSRFYCNHPIAPLAQHVYMLNLDMVGRNPQKPIEIQGVGSGEGGTLRKIVERAAEKNGLKSKITDQVTLLGGDRDHSSFRDRKVPYTFFFSGFHRDYHRPSDSADKLSYDQLVKVSGTAIDILLEVAALDERPVWSGKQPGGLQLPDADPAHPPRRLGVTVQELDDAECEALKLEAGQGALRVDAVHTASAAEAAGLRSGDHILSIGGEKLPRSGGREVLRAAIADKVKPGEEVEVVVLRKGEKVALKAKWQE
jgi:hypothetical protein